MKKIVYFLFPILFIFSSCTSCIAQENTEKKAIIFVPGVLSSGLFYNGDDSPTYKDNEAIWLNMENTNTLTNITRIKKFLSHYSDIFCDSNGYPINPKIGLAQSSKFPSKMDENIAKYGYGNNSEKIINFLYDKYDKKNGRKYSVILFNYDWRLDCSHNAELLKNTILKYNEVILIGHSCGGLISCKAARELYDLGQLDRVKHFISLATPFNGSVDGLFMLENGIEITDDMVGQLIKKFHVDEIFKALSCNCTATYQLLPTKHYFAASQTGCIKTPEKELSTYDETINFIKSRNYYKDENGNLKTFLETAKKFHDSLYLEDGVHILNKMDSYLIVGSGQKTLSQLTTNDKKNSVDIVKYTDGDGTVALAESAATKDFLDDQKIFKFDCKHSQIINDTRILNLISEIIK